jgi:pSer/pThr/pTyr-binding forkhead associated (FHA) protein
MDGSRRGHRVTLNLGLAVFGRARGSTVRIPSERISRRHCRIWLERRKIWVQDLGSQNGTYVNDEVVIGKVQLSHGDELKVGHVRFRLQFVPDEDDRETDDLRVPMRRETSPGLATADPDMMELVPLDEPEPGDFNLPLQDEDDQPARPSESFDIPVQDPMDFRDILRELDEGSEDD